MDLLTERTAEHSRVRDHDFEGSMATLNYEAGTARERAGKLEERAADLEEEAQTLRLQVEREKIERLPRRMAEPFDPRLHNEVR